jgi:hypothetical protein
MAPRDIVSDVASLNGGDTAFYTSSTYFSASGPSHSCIRDYDLDHTNAIFDFQSQLLEAYISRINDHDDHEQSVREPELRGWSWGAI